MKKIHVAMVCVLAGVSIMMTGCKKEEGEIVTLGAEIADGIGDGKVYLDGDGYPSWESSDHLWVNGDEKALSNITGTRAKVEGVTSADDYVAVFPYNAGVSRIGNSATVTNCCPDGGIHYKNNTIVPQRMLLGESDGDKQQWPSSLCKAHCHQFIDSYHG